ncbi:DMT family transporter [Gordonia hydrophobica]|uniref:SMR family transporter n=1 Tax=Gordonia hydrophobica TaxID=40516 RepID=A0ABZ2TZA2_9ACTN|nr:SMR family transporter [Gordonia hydrophobica]MBM7369459.1 small multidrug resistance pump [Gordonia hydrophobica]
MRKWLLLSGAIIAEVTATMLLRASIEHPVWTVGVVIGYVAAFALLGLTLRHGVAIGVAYGIWGAAGVALTAVFGAVLFDEVLSARAIVGVGVIVVGVLVVETSARPVSPDETVEVGR